MTTVRPGAISLVLALQLAGTQLPPVPALPPQVPPFEVWLADLRAEAAARGISAALIEQTLSGVEPVPQILERDRTQAEFAPKRPDGRCASGPSIRSANTVSMIACRRWVMSAAAVGSSLLVRNGW